MVCHLQNADFSLTYLKLDHSLDIEDIECIESFPIKFCPHILYIDILFIPKYFGLSIGFKRYKDTELLGI